MALLSLLTCLHAFGALGGLLLHREFMQRVHQFVRLLVEQVRSGLHQCRFLWQPRRDERLIFLHSGQVASGSLSLLLLQLLVQLILLLCASFTLRQFSLESGIGISLICGVLFASAEGFTDLSACRVALQHSRNTRERVYTGNPLWQGSHLIQSNRRCCRGRG